MTKTSRELPITFSADMVNALIAGSKTMTRRIARQDKYGNLKPCRYKADDILWVRESWQVEAWDEENGIMQVNYRNGKTSGWLDVPCPEMFERYWIACSDELAKKEVNPDAEGQHHWEKGKSPLRWRNARFMPRWASRITLEVVEVHRERLHDITEKDARAEGAQRIAGTRNQTSFIKIWDSLYDNHPDKGWDANPLIDVIAFKVLEVKHD